MPRTALEATYKVLKEAETPLHYEEITRRVLESGLWQTRGKTPGATVNARLAVDIKRHGPASRFRRVGRGIFTVSEASPTSTAQAVTRQESGLRTSEAGPMPFLDAAEKILRDSGSNEAMSYVEITSRAMEEGLIRPEGLTPAASLSAQVGVDIRRREARGERPRFVRPERGKIGLAPALPSDVAQQIEEQNRRVQAKLLERARQSSPGGFEQLVGDLLEAMGFEEVEVTSLGADGGIDVRGTLVVADVVRLRMAVQAKRWKQNVQKPIVQQVRGSLGAHEQGLIITTSGFSKGLARKQDGPTRHQWPSWMVSSLPACLQRKRSEQSGRSTTSGRC